jgi:hypothetical protein
MSAGRVQSSCLNPDHEEDVPAIYDVSFPNGDWHGTLACADCLTIILDNMLDCPTMVLFQPVTAPARGTSQKDPSQ